MALFMAVFLAVLMVVYWREAIVLIAVLLLALILLGLITVVDGIGSRSGDSTAKPEPDQVTITVIS